ncbi:hypothetical protein MUP95_00010 [bacterium]|nr:hypothetical protein [bacterium]
MATENDKKNKLWFNALLNGIFAWILGFVIYMIPAFVVAIRMGIELGPKSDDPAAVSEQISQTISGMYRNNILFTIGFIIVTALFILWRAIRVAKKSVDKKSSMGLLVALIPALFGLLFMFSNGLNILSFVEILVFIAAGYTGGYLSK